MQAFFNHFDRILNPRRLRYAWITGGALWLTWLLSILLGPGNMDLAHQVIGTDYLQFHSAGATLRLGESQNLYNFDYQAELEYRIAGEGLVNYHLFITPPFFAYIFLPLSYLPYVLSFVVWSMLGLAGLYFTIRLLEREQSKKIFLWSLTFFPVFATISFGQNSLLSLFLFGLTYLAWRKRLPFLAGLIASLLLYKPQLVLGVGLLWLLAWKRDWKALAGLAVGAISLAALSFAALPEASSEFLLLSNTLLGSMLSWEYFPIWHAHTWRAFWYLLLPGNYVIEEFLYLLSVLVGGIAFLFFWKKLHNNDPLMFAAAVCLTIWVTPHAMIYDWALLLIPAIIFWKEKAALRTTWKVVMASVWIATFLSGPLTHVQLQIMPVAAQLSLPIFGWACFLAYQSLMKREGPLMEIANVSQQSDQDFSTGQPDLPVVDLSIVIPALNEGENLTTLVPEIKQVLAKLSVKSEIIIVDENPDELTHQVANQYQAVLLSPDTHGYGMAIVNGIKYARGAYIISMDADYSHPTVFIEDLWKARRSGDIIIASRYVTGGKAIMPFSRYFLSRVLNLFFSLGLRIPVRDLSSGYRLYSANAVNIQQVRCNNFDILQELLVRAVVAGKRIKEIPFTYAPRKHGSSHARVLKFGMAYLRTFGRLFRLRYFTSNQ